MTFNSFADTCRYIVPCQILIVPQSDGFPITGKALQSGKGSTTPVAGAQNQGNNLRHTRIMALQCPLHLNGIAVIGGEKVGADEQKNDGGLFQMGINSLSPI